jgi:chromosome segregation ATPase
MSKCKSLVEAETEAQRWRRIARRRRLDAEAQAEELTRVQRRLERVKALREEEREISEDYSNSAEKEINRLSDELERATKTVKELKDRNLTIPAEHSFAEHEAYLTVGAKIEELTNKLHDCEYNWACEQNELRCRVAEALDYDKGSYDGCEIVEEVTELKHKYDNAMEVLAATTRQRDQLNNDLNRYKLSGQELDKASKGYRELQSAIAQVLGNDIDEGADDLDILQEFTTLKARLDEMQKVLAQNLITNKRG